MSLEKFWKKNKTTTTEHVEFFIGTRSEQDEYTIIHEDIATRPLCTARPSYSIPPPPPFTPPLPPLPTNVWTYTSQKEYKILMDYHETNWNNTQSNEESQIGSDHNLAANSDSLSDDTTNVHPRRPMQPSSFSSPPIEEDNDFSSKNLCRAICFLCVVLMTTLLIVVIDSLFF